MPVGYLPPVTRLQGDCGLGNKFVMELKDMKYIIIGNGVSSVGAIEAIRKNDKTGSITVFTDEKFPCYGRPLISYYLEGKTSTDKMSYRGGNFYKDNNVTLKLGAAITKIDPTSKTVTAGGKEYAYGKLLVATGSSPFVPPTPGYDRVKNKFTFIRLSDALAIEKHVGADKRALIIGAGLTGLKCAEGLYGRVGKITVVDMADRVLPAVTDSDASEIVRAHLESKGMEFFLSDSVAEYEENAAVLKSGRRIEFDILITSVGVRPNVSLVADAGGAVEIPTETGRPIRGIVVDETQLTTLPDVYAAGDCTLSYDVTVGCARMLALQPNAYLQGETAGNAMSGGVTFRRDYLPVNAGGFLGLHMITAGSYVGDAITANADGAFRRFFVKNDRLTGFILIGGYDRAGILTDMIRKRTPVSSVDFEEMIKQPALGALGMDYVRAVLGK